MTKLSRKNRKVYYYVLFGVLLACGLVIASNMGFKLVYRFYAPVATPPTNAGENWCAVPYNFPFTNSQTFFDDIDAVSGSASQVSRWLRTDDKLQSYTGGKGDPIFPIVAGEAYLVKVSANTDYVIVGSHQPGLGLNLYAPVTSPPTNAGENWLSVPYHCTYNNSEDVYNDIPNCSQFSRWLRTDDKLQSYTGGKGDPVFPLAPGEGYLVKVSTDVTWTPSHF